MYTETNKKPLKAKIRKGKEEYPQKREENFKSSNMNRVWDGMKLMSGYKGKKGGQDRGLLAEELDAF